MSLRVTVIRDLVTSVAGVGARRACLVVVLWVAGLAGAPVASAEDGYDLWLRYRPIEQPWADRYRAALTHSSRAPHRPRYRWHTQSYNAGCRDCRVSRSPWRRACRGWRTRRRYPALLPLLGQLRGCRCHLPGSQGYAIRSATIGGHSALIVAADDDVVASCTASFTCCACCRPGSCSSGWNCAYRLSSCASSIIGTISIAASSVHGQSLWDWHKLPDYIDPRYVDYARANASLGINGTVLTNVNSNAVSLRPDYLEKALAGTRSVHT